MISSQQWRYFLSIDNDLLKLSRYIEFTSDNYSVYSIELVRLYLSICSEIDSLMKSLCDNADSQLYAATLNGNSGRRTRPNMGAYRAFLDIKFPQFKAIECKIPAFQITLSPWDAFSTGVNPSWWSAHNDVKHERDTHFPKANLENVLSATAGLLVVNLYYMAWDKNPPLDDLPRPKLFEIPERLCQGGARWDGGCLYIPERL